MFFEHQPRAGQNSARKGSCVVPWPPHCEAVGREGGSGPIADGARFCPAGQPVEPMSDRQADKFHFTSQLRLPGMQAREFQVPVRTRRGAAGGILSVCCVDGRSGSRSRGFGLWLEAPSSPPLSYKGQERRGPGACLGKQEVARPQPLARADSVGLFPRPVSGEGTRQ